MEGYGVGGKSPEFVILVSSLTSCGTLSESLNHFMPCFPSLAKEEEEHGFCLLRLGLGTVGLSG